MKSGISININLKLVFKNQTKKKWSWRIVCFLVNLNLINFVGKIAYQSQSNNQAYSFRLSILEIMQNVIQNPIVSYMKAHWWGRAVIELFKVKNPIKLQVNINLEPSVFTFSKFVLLLTVFLSIAKDKVQS